MTFWFWRKYRKLRKQAIKKRRINHLKQISLGRQLIRSQEEMIKMQEEVISNFTQIVENYKSYHEQTEFTVKLEESDWTGFYTKS